MPFIYSVLALIALLIVPTPAHAIVNSAVAVSILASDGTTRGTAGALAGTITKSAWRTVISSTSKALKGITVFNSTPVPIQIAIGASGSESVQIIVPPGTLPGQAYPGSPAGTYNVGQGVYYPIAISQGTKVAIEALNSDANAGEFDVNAFYY